MEVIMVDTAKAKQLGKDIISTANTIEQYQDDVEVIKQSGPYNLFKNTSCISNSSIMDDVKKFYINRVQQSICESEKALSDLIGGSTEPAKRKATAPR